jgi:hypothetical protein
MNMPSMQQPCLPVFCLVNRSMLPSSAAAAAACALTSLHPLTHFDIVAAMLNLAPSFVLEEARPLHAAELAESHTGTVLSPMVVALQVLPPPPTAASPRSTNLLADTPRHATSARLSLQHCEGRIQEAADTMARAVEAPGEQHDLALAATTCLALARCSNVSAVMHRAAYAALQDSLGCTPGPFVPNCASRLCTPSGSAAPPSRIPLKWHAACRPSS